MDFFSLLTDPKILLLIAAIVLLGALGYYVWRQSTIIEELTLKNDKMMEQVKHGLILDERQEHQAKIRQDMQSNMSEETDNENEHDEQEWQDMHETDAEGDDADDESEDEEHNAYIQSLIKLQDHKRAEEDEYFQPSQQQPGHNGPVYDSEEEDVVFRNYESDDEVSESELAKLAADELKEVSAAAAPAPVPAPAQAEPVIPVVVELESQDKEAAETPMPLAVPAPAPAPVLAPLPLKQKKAISVKEKDKVKVKVSKKI